MLQSSSEPWFGPELCELDLKSSLKFSIRAELNLKSSSGFKRGPRSGELHSDRTEPEPCTALSCSHASAILPSHTLTLV
jgi:hypothetical protein